MSPTKEVSERQRAAAFKAWETIRRKKNLQQGAGGDLAKRAEPVPKVRRSQQKATGKSKSVEYPATWKEIGVEIRNRSKNQRGLEQCECHGECLKHAGRCEEINHTWPEHRRRKGKVRIRFTIAHLCHIKKCALRSHLRAMCEPCHLIYDLRCRQQSLRGNRAVLWSAQRKGEPEFCEADSFRTDSDHD